MITEVCINLGVFISSILSHSLFITEYLSTDFNGSPLNPPITYMYLKSGDTKDVNVHLGTFIEATSVHLFVTSSYLKLY